MNAINKMKHAARGEWSSNLQHIPDALNAGIETINDLLESLEMATATLEDYAGTTEAPTIRRLREKIASVRAET